MRCDCIGDHRAAYSAESRTHVSVSLMASGARHSTRLWLLMNRNVLYTLNSLIRRGEWHNFVNQVYLNFAGNPYKWPSIMTLVYQHRCRD